MPASAPTPTTPASAAPAAPATRRGANGSAGWAEAVGRSKTVGAMGEVNSNNIDDD